MTQSIDVFLRSWAIHVNYHRYIMFISKGNKGIAHKLGKMQSTSLTLTFDLLIKNAIGDHVR